MEKGDDRGFVLHSRRFRENSRILDVFTYGHGRLSLLARVSRKQALRKTLLFQSFTELSLSWRGGGSLPNLGFVEEIQALPMSGKQAVCGLYCNELLIYSLASSIVVPELYLFYRTTLQRLSGQRFDESYLREFESRILEESGQGLDFFHDCNTGGELGRSGAYYYQPGYGFSVKEPTGERLQINTRDMQALQSGQLTMQDNPKGVKMVYRAAINHMLQNRSLNSRQLFRELAKLK